MSWQFCVGSLSGKIWILEQHMFYFRRVAYAATQAFRSRDRLGASDSASRPVASFWCFDVSIVHSSVNVFAEFMAVHPYKGHDGPGNPCKLSQLP
jgi:hypothetical protein